MMASECTEEAVLEFLTNRGGMVRHMDLTDHFELIRKNYPSQNTLYTETLKRIVDSIAIVKLEDGVKFVCLKNECMGSVKRTDSNGHDGECKGNGVSVGESPLSEHDNRAGSINMNSTESNAALVKELSDNYVNGNTTIGHTVSEDKNARNSLTGLDNEEQSNGNDHPCVEKESVLAQSDETVDPSSVEVRLRERKRRESAPVIGSVPDPAHSGVVPVHVRGGRRVSRCSQRALLTSGLSEDSAWEGLDSMGVSGDGNTPKSSRRNFIELMMSSSPQVRRSMIHRGSRIRDSVRSDGDSASLHSSLTDEDCASVALDPLEHEWMLCASDGLWDSLQPLLSLDPSLVSKKDFVTGFTCLHWAAKQGKQELMSQLLDFAKQNSVSVDVNARSSAGYTPLHLAAMHSHTQVVRMLVEEWDADTDARDYSGRRAGQYLPPAAVADLQDGAVTSPGGDSDTENTDSGAGRWRLPRVLQSNLNPLRLLNLPAEGAGDGGGTGRTKSVHRKSSLSRLNARLHRGRFRTQIIHSTSFRETGEGEGGDEPPTSPLKPRPLSNLFG